MIATWQNECRAARCSTTERPLTRSLDLREEGLAMQATHTCSVTDCERPHYGRGLCQRHLERQRRADRKSSAAPHCEIPDCGDAVVSRGWCEGHYRRWVDHGDPLAGRRSPSPGPCSVVACEEPKQGRGYCVVHYGRWKRTGDPEGLAPPRPVKLCSIEGCDRKHSARGWCALHHGRWLSNGDPLVAQPSYWSATGALSPNWAGDAVTYSGMHIRLRRVLGTPQQHGCVDCGAEAAHWSYDHADPAELIEDGLPYSVKIGHYQPRCRSCHTKFDRRTSR